MFTYGVVNGIEIGWFQGQISAVGACAGVAGGDEKLAHARALAQFTGYCGFTTATAEQQHVNRFHYIFFSVIYLSFSPDWPGRSFLRTRHAGRLIIISLSADICG